MGAQQSSTRSDETGAGVAPIRKTCYYELLSVDRQATDDEIKKAYRRKALELHPDRNLDNVALATEKFAEVQSAYEILSDPQERAWYDSHRDAILSGDDGLDGGGAEPTSFRNVRLTSTEEIMSLMRKFNASIPFTDEPNGFFGITRETFEHLALEEEAAAEYDSLDNLEYPSFGSSNDDYESVVRPFYSAWANFSTKKSFSWKDKYRLSDAPDRRVRRLMEKENKKLRDDAAREFNDTVRFLVGFVRKRDPRYIPNTQTESERQKAMRDAAAAQAARSRAANQEKLASSEVPEWAISRDDSTEEEDHFTESEEESEVEVLECVVCDKIFKSPNQLDAHERSKKHVKAVQQLRRQMRKEGKELDLGAEEPNSSSNKKKKKSEPVADVESESEPESAQEKENDEATDEGVDDDNQHAGKKDPETNPEKDAASLDTPTSDDDDDYAPRSAVQDRLFNETNGQGNTEKQSDDEEISTTLNQTSIDEPAAPQKKVGKAKAKREKKAAREAQTAEACGVCSETFTSRTKLFQHIRDEGHATPVQTKSKGGKKKR